MKIDLDLFGTNYRKDKMILGKVALVNINIIIYNHPKYPHY